MVVTGGQQVPGAGVRGEDVRGQMSGDGVQLTGRAGRQLLTPVPLIFRPDGTRARTGRNSVAHTVARCVRVRVARPSRGDRQFNRRRRTCKHHTHVVVLSASSTRRRYRVNAVVFCTGDSRRQLMNRSVTNPRQHPTATTGFDKS